MKVHGLVALQDFTTQDATGIIRGVKGEELPPVYYSTAERLVKNKFAKKIRVRKSKEGEA